MSVSSAQAFNNKYKLTNWVIPPIGEKGNAAASTQREDSSGNTRQIMELQLKMMEMQLKLTEAEAAKSKAELELRRFSISPNGGVAQDQVNTLQAKSHMKTSEKLKSAQLAEIEAKNKRIERLTDLKKQLNKKNSELSSKQQVFLEISHQIDTVLPNVIADLGKVLAGYSNMEHQKKEHQRVCKIWLDQKNYFGSITMDDQFYNTGKGKLSFDQKKFIAGKMDQIRGWGLIPNNYSDESRKAAENSYLEQFEKEASALASDFQRMNSDLGHYPSMVKRETDLRKEMTEANEKMIRVLPAQRNTLKVEIEKIKAEKKVFDEEIEELEFLLSRKKTVVLT